MDMGGKVMSGQRQLKWLNWLSLPCTAGGFLNTIEEFINTDLRSIAPGHRLVIFQQVNSSYNPSRHRRPGIQQ